VSDIGATSWASGICPAGLLGPLAWQAKSGPPISRKEERVKVSTIVPGNDYVGARSGEFVKQLNFVPLENTALEK
jgi:hypothetical protein